MPYYRFHSKIEFDLVALEPISVKKFLVERKAKRNHFNHHFQGQWPLEDHISNGQYFFLSKPYKTCACIQYTVYSVHFNNRSLHNTDSIYGSPLNLRNKSYQDLIQEGPQTNKRVTVTLLLLNGKQ